MPTLGELLPNLPFGLDCDSIADIGNGLINTAQELIDFEDSLTTSPVSRNPSIIQARLSLESGVAVSTTDQSGINTLYYVPFNGQVVPLYDGTAVDFIDRYLTSQISLSLSGITDNTVHDVFANSDGANIVLSLEQWASAVARNVALTTEKGILVKTGALTHRYIGTIRINATGGQCEDTILRRFVWNMYHRRRREMLVQITDNQWVYSTATWRASNGNPDYRVECVMGLAEDIIDGTFYQSVASTVGAALGVGIGLDTTTASNAKSQGGFSGSGISPPYTATYRGHPGIGYHFFQCVERGAGSGTQTFYGTFSDPGRHQSALSMTIVN